MASVIPLKKLVSGLMNVMRLSGKPQMRFRSEVQPVIDVGDIVYEKRTLIIPATAGNVVYNLSPGVGKRWKVLRGRVPLTCDVSVADRSIVFDLTDGVDITERLGKTGAITASTSGALDFGELVYVNNVVPGVNYYLGISMPIVLEGVDQFRVSILNGVVGDSYGGLIVVLEQSVS